MSTTRIVAMTLIIAGILGLVYGGFSYTRSKGLFAGISLAGVVMTTDAEANASYRGEGHYYSGSILLDNAPKHRLQPLRPTLMELIGKTEE